MVNTCSILAANSMVTMAANVDIDGTVGEVEQLINHFFTRIGSAQYNSVHLLFNLIFLFVCFIIRYNSYFKIVNISTNNDEDKKLYSRYRAYVLSHVLLSAIFAYIVCYILIKIVNSAEIVAIWNTIVSPLIGFLSSIWFDNEVLCKYENQYKLLRNPLTKDSEKKENKPSNDGENHNEINITINNGDDQPKGTDDKFVLEGDESLSDSEKIEATINRIIEVQKEQSLILEKHTQELQDQNTILKNMQTLMKNNIKFELEDMIYAVLDRGYVTPAEDKKIRVKYSDYRSNEGNGDLKELYESRYLDLDVHEHHRN